VIDALCSAPPGTVLGWLAANTELLDRVRAAWPVLGFTRPILAGADAAQIIAAADMLVFDFTATDRDGPVPAAIAAAFRRAVAAERMRLDNHPPRRFIAVNAVGNAAEPLVAARIGATLAPFSTRLRQGFVRPRPPPALQSGVAGESVADGIRIRTLVRGQVATALCHDLTPGRWSIAFALHPRHRWLTLPGPLKLDATAADAPGTLAHRYLLAGPRWAQRLRLDFTVPPGDPRDVVVRLHSIGLVAGRIAGVTVRRLG
jgi:hypothetical protein